MHTLITVLDNITETSMPFNEFVLYRAAAYKDERQIVIVCNSEEKLPDVNIPGNVEIIYAGKKLSNIRSAINSVIKKCRCDNEPYAVHIHQVTSGVLSNIAMLGTKFRKKTVFSVHSTYTGYKLHNKIRSLINAFMARYIICVSETSYKNYPKIIKCIKKERITAIQNGVNLKRIDNIEVNQRTETDIIEFIYVARMIPIKNHAFLLDVIKETDNKAHFVFVGAEDSQGNIRRRIETEGLTDRIELTGLIPRNEVFKRLKTSDVYISPSTLEGLPVSVLEAMCTGIPAILSDIQQHNEIAGNTDIISLLPLNKEIWVKEINRYTNMSHAERRDIGQKSREYVYETFSLEKMHSSYNKIYNELMRQ